jgi:hypothetical protein
LSKQYSLHFFSSFSSNHFKKIKTVIFFSFFSGMDCLSESLKKNHQERIRLSLKLFLLIIENEQLGPNWNVFLCYFN